jgi:putative ABC transport system permease protein
VNGSSASQVISIVLGETLIVVVLAIFAASAGSYVVMNQWLTGYSQRIHMHPGYFLISALLVAAMAIGATIWQAWRAATGNPVKALRYE